MPRRYRNFEDAFNARAAANDNAPANKPKQPRYRGTLPALKWLFDNHPELAPAIADALPKPKATSWSADVVENRQEIRPTIGETMKAASDAFRVYVRDGVRHVGAGLRVEDGEWVHLGLLRFYRGRLQEWGRTRKGKRLKPVDRITSGLNERAAHRSPVRYLATRPTTPSPLHAEPHRRAASGERAIPPMFDPLDGVEHARNELADAYANTAQLPLVTKCPTVVAKGASFIGGVSRPSGNASKAAPPLWESREKQKGEVREVLEEVAARGTLKSIGERLGYPGDYADRAGKRALLEAARVLVAANDNQRKKAAA